MSRVEALGHGVEVVVEQAGVHVESHRCIGVTEHPLHRLDRGARRNASDAGVP